MTRCHFAHCFTVTLLASRLFLGAQEIPTLTPPSVPAQIDSLMTKRYEADQPGGVVLVMRDGKSLFRKAYGLASLELGVPMQPDMVLRIGSITKQITAAAILKLVEEGKVDLKAPIARYLDPLPRGWEVATVEQLLNHTAGIPNHTETAAYKARLREDMTPSELLAAYVANLPLDFEPGTKYHYSNTGYILLGMLVEKVSGQSYGDFLQKRFFDPLGLKHLRYGSEEELIPGLVPGYTKWPKPCDYRSTSQTFASGGLVATADDVARWLQLLYEGKILKAASLARMLANLRLRDGKEVGYGFGIGFRPVLGLRLAGHAGGVPGYKSWAEADPTTRTIVVILNNTDAPKGDDATYAKALFSILAGMPIQEP
jgi:D-alanyl-D-alanine carboxypeptidase